MTKSFNTRAGSLTAALFLTAGLGLAQQYTFQKIYNFPAQSYPTLSVDLTSAGQIVGTYTNFATFANAYVVTNGKLQVVRVPNVPNGGYIYASKDGQALVSAGPEYGVYLYNIATASASPLKTGTYGFTPSGLNDVGDVVGVGYQFPIQDRGRPSVLFSFLTFDFNYYNYPDSTATTLKDINNSLTIVGSYIQSNGEQGFLLPNGGTPQKITFPGSVRPVPLSINSQGKVYGFYNTSNSTAPFVFDGTNYINVQPPNTSACQLGRIKDNGTVVIACSQDLTTNTAAVYLATPTGR